MPDPTEFGRYRVDRRIGSGAFATVWLAHDDLLDSPVAVKVLADNWTDRLDIRGRFAEEARILRRADSDHVVRVHDLGELDDGRPYFVMTYADAGTLADRLTDGPLSVADTLRHALGVADGLAVLHGLGVVHRDVKPSNVLFHSGRAGADGADKLLIADLGLARAVAHASGFTLAAGTPGYMAPEQGVMGGGVDARADVYALGALIVHMRTGRPLRSVPDAAAVEAVQAEAVAISGSLAPVVHRALSFRPADRYGSAGEMATALRAVAPAPAPSPSPEDDAQWDTTETMARSDYGSGSGSGSGSGGYRSGSVPSSGGWAVSPVPASAGDSRSAGPGPSGARSGAVPAVRGAGSRPAAVRSPVPAAPLDSPAEAPFAPPADPSVDSSAAGSPAAKLEQQRARRRTFRSRARRRRRAVLVGVVALVVAAAGGGGYAAWRAYGDRGAWTTVGDRGLSVRVPRDWSGQYRTGTWTPTGLGTDTTGHGLEVADDVSAWARSGSATPGVFLGVADGLSSKNADRLLDGITHPGCQRPAGGSGSSRTWSGCPGGIVFTDSVLQRGGTTVFVQVKRPAGRDDTAAIVDSVTAGR